MGGLGLKKALHQVLAKKRSEKLRKFKETSTNSTGAVASSIDTGGSFMMSVKRILPELSSRLKVQSRKITEFYKQSPLAVVNFKYKDLLRMMDPVIFNFISHLTINDQEQKTVSNFPSDSYILSEVAGDHAKRQLHRRINVVLMLPKLFW